MVYRLLVCLAVLALSRPAFADFDQSAAWFNSMDDAARRVLQVDLMYTGNYEGEDDAEFGPLTFDALQGFQRDQHLPVTGVLTPTERRLLSDEARREAAYLGFQLVEDPSTGLAVGIPTAFLASPERTSRGSIWAGVGGEGSLETMRYTASEISFDALFARFSQPTPNRTVTYRTKLSDAFVISGGMSPDMLYYMRFERTATGASVGFALRWFPEYRFFRRVAVLMSNTLAERSIVVTPPAAAFPTPAAPSPQPSVAAEPPRVAPPVPSASPSPGVIVEGAGSGFFISSGGHVATAAHVVEGCSSIEVQNYGRARIVRADEVNDIAILSVAASNTPAAQFRIGSIRLGEEVTAMGFPLSDILGRSLTVTGGNVSALSGIDGDVRFLQISAPVQPGNSGGPLFDESGRLVGVVTARLDDLATLGRSGSLPQNVNFAVKATLLAGLMEAAGVDPAYGGDRPPMSMADVADIGGDLTVQVLCHG
ncbi:MAG: trypsin-like peptidase domain-containing protein [Bauldia sp.]|nr:trypsin-like peptidase domain-containing protein [Bauldia sp.]